MANVPVAGTEQRTLSSIMTFMLLFPTPDPLYDTAALCAVHVSRVVAVLEISGGTSMSGAPALGASQRVTSPFMFGHVVLLQHGGTR